MIRNVRDELKVENIIMYIPVTEATWGGTPMLNSRGLKMTPPPKPRAPEIQPPKKANISSLTTTL